MTFCSDYSNSFYCYQKLTHSNINIAAAGESLLSLLIVPKDMRRIQFVHEGKRITHIELFTLINGTDLIMPIEVIDEIFSYITCGKTFKEVLYLSKYFHSNYEPKIPQYISVSINEVLGMLENATFYYEILTDRVIDNELSVDQLHRHVLEDFGIYETNSYDIVTRENGKQYLSMTLRMGDDTYSECDNNDEATPENITMYFPEMSIGGKFIIPKSFKDEMYVMNPYDPDDSLSGEGSTYESIEVEMRFDKVDGDNKLQSAGSGMEHHSVLTSGIDLLQYITIV
jgi:hypothetical protein